MYIKTGEVQVGNISVQPTTTGIGGTWGSVAFNNFWDPIALQGRRLANGPVNGIAFAPSIPNSSWVNGGVYLFSAQNGNIGQPYSAASTLTLTPQMLELRGLTPDVLFRYDFPTSNTEGTFYIKEKVYIGAEKADFTNNNEPNPPFESAGFYKLLVNGSILTKELVIEPKALPPFPDYVFSEDYNLPSLDEVDDYILEHNKLPNLPSADHVQKQGLAIADISIKLVEKVEELTLYLIQLHKDNEELKKRIESLENE